MVGWDRLANQIEDGEIDDTVKIVACTWKQALDLQEGWKAQCAEGTIAAKAVKVALVVTEE
eukprot:2337438-Pyramimonas_sp.AAC.1